MAEEEIGPAAVRPIDNSMWHLADAERPLTWCAIVIQYGSRRQLWAQTPEEERCDLCLRRVGL